MDIWAISQPALTCSMLTIETLEQDVKYGVFIANFEHISYLVLVFRLLTLNIWLPAGIIVPHSLGMINKSRLLWESSAKEYQWHNIIIIIIIIIINNNNNNNENYNNNIRLRYIMMIVIVTDGIIVKKLIIITAQKNKVFH